MYVRFQETDLLADRCNVFGIHYTRTFNEYHQITRNPTLRIVHGAGFSIILAWQVKHFKGIFSLVSITCN